MEYNKLFFLLILISPILCQLKCDTDEDGTCTILHSQVLEANTTGSGTGKLLISGGISITCEIPLCSISLNYSSIEINGVISAAYVFIIASDVTVSQGAAINNSARGYPASQGQRMGQSLASGAGGGGYGGDGAGGSIVQGNVGALGGIAFGYSSYPTELGSGGGNGSTTNSGGSGGGHIFMNVSGQLTVYGIIACNGGNGVNGGGGGSGGSIIIYAGTITCTTCSTAVISANGGSGSLGGGGGGGGRIMYESPVNTYSGSILVKGGLSGTGSLLGGAGSIYDVLSSTLTYACKPNPNEVCGQSSVYISSVQGAHITIQDYAKVALAENTSLAIETETISLTNGGQVLCLACSVNLTLEQFSVMDNCVFNISSNATLNVFSVQVSGTLTARTLIITSNNIVVKQNGNISSTGTGYFAGYGAGINGAGGGYGGTGGSGHNSQPGGSTYGDIFTPHHGSGGGSLGGSGGGVIQIATSSLQIDGTIAANGYPGYNGGGGGSGGFINILANLINCSVCPFALISAAGGAGYNNSGGGGGGRIVMQFTTMRQNSISVIAPGGASSSSNNYLYGGAGSIVVLSQTASTLYYNCETNHPCSPTTLPQTINPFPSPITTVRLGYTSVVLPPFTVFNGLTFTMVNSSMSSSSTISLFVQSFSMDNGSSIVTAENIQLQIEAQQLNISGTILASPIVLNSSTLFISGVISASGLGYAANSGPGAGNTAPTGIGSGAGHGGMGGYTNSLAGGAVYDSMSIPHYAGSGGGGAGGFGGGVITINSLSLLLEGSIIADGTSASVLYGGGSGGSIFVHSDVINCIACNSFISARGGDGGGGGGGGRISLAASIVSNNIRINVSGGSGATPGIGDGQAGSYYEMCVPGYIGTGGNCKICNPGTYSMGYDADACISCSAGTYAAAAGASSCNICPWGTYSNSGAPQCADCSQGEYQNNTQSSSCISCDPGTFANVTGQQYCWDCLPGTYANGTGNSNCTNCTAGYSQKEYRATECTPCDPGSYTQNNMSQTCTECQVNNFSPGGSVPCQPCPKHKVSNHRESECHYATSTKLAIGFGSALIVLVIVLIVAGAWYYWSVWRHRRQFQPVRS